MFDESRLYRNEDYLRARSCMNLVHITPYHERLMHLKTRGPSNKAIVNIRPVV